MSLSLGTWAERRSLAMLDGLANAESMRAIREGLLWIVPALLVSSSFLVLAEILRALGTAPALVGKLLALHAGLGQIIPHLVAASVGYMLSISHRVPRLPVAILCLFNISIASVMLDEYPRLMAAFILPIAIVLPLLLVPLITVLHRLPCLQLVKVDFAGNNVRDALNLVIPGVLSAALLTALFGIVIWSPLSSLFSEPLILPLTEHPYASGALVGLFNSLLWFFGVHGYYALQSVFELLNQAVALNATDVQAGRPALHQLNTSLLGAFVFIGGSGGTFSLLLAMLAFCRHRSMRLLAWASFPLALFNINEVLLFGLPIILNPRLIIPFFAVPVINAVLSLAIMQSGLVSAVTVALPLNSPVVVNAYLATGGDPAAIVLQLALLGLDALIYLPFILAIDRRLGEPMSFHVHSLETTITRLHEEVSLNAYDAVAVANTSRRLMAERCEQIRQIGEYRFFLEFQPQISIKTGHCVGCEVLLRAHDASGAKQQPWQFMQSLEQAGLMKDLDLWVAGAAQQQDVAWQKAGVALPMTINVTSQTLSDAVVRKRLLDILTLAEGRISVEITEQAIASDVQSMQAAIADFHRIGAKVYIDDFGTGYSALGYLHQFDIDAIKIDRCFVLAQETDKGRKVMDGLLRFAETLGIDVVVEGVETESQLNALSSAADLVIQGWYFSKSLAGEHIPAYVRERSVGVPAAT